MKNTIKKNTKLRNNEMLEWLGGLLIGIAIGICIGKKKKD